MANPQARLSAIFYVTVDEGEGHCHRKPVSGEQPFWQLLSLSLSISWEFRETPWLSTLNCGDQLLVHVALLSIPFSTHILSLRFPLGPAGSKDWMIAPFPLWASWYYLVSPFSRKDQNNFSSTILFHLLCFLPFYFLFFPSLDYVSGEKKSNSHWIRKFQVGSSKTAHWITSIWWHPCTHIYTHINKQ